MEEKKNYQFSGTINEEIFELVVTGEITRDAIAQLHGDVIRFLKGKEIKALLIDVRALRVRSGDAVADAYFRTRNLPLDIITLPAALVDPNENAEYISFYETAAANVGQSIKWFMDIGAARTWLKSRLR